MFSTGIVGMQHTAADERSSGLAVQLTIAVKWCSAFPLILWLYV